MGNKNIDARKTRLSLCVSAPLRLLSNKSDSLPQSPQRSQRMFKTQRLSDILKISVGSVISVVKFLLSLGKGPCRTVSLCIKILSLTAILAALPLSAQCPNCSSGSLLIEPYNYGENAQCWEYGPSVIRAQTITILKPLMDDWYAKNGERFDKPRILLTRINNTTGEYIASNEVRAAFQSAADDDGRFTVILEDVADDCEFNRVTNAFDKIQKREDEIRVKEGEKIIPDFFAKIRFKKVEACPYEEYWMTIALYDVETKALIGSGTNVFRRQLRR
jgi:hypothetical protein